MGLYRQFILMVGDLRRWHVCTLIDGLKFHFDLALFIKRRKVQVRGLEFRGKVNQIKSCNILSSVPWAVVFILPWVVGISPWSTMAQTPS